MTLLRTPVRPLDVKRTGNFRVGMRNQIPGETFMKWQQISRWGYTVVCPSYKEALELVMLLGSRMYQAPYTMNDRNYVRWLLYYHFYIEGNYTVTGRKEMMFAEWLRGWVPDAGQMIRGEASPLIVHRCLDPDRTRSEAGDLVSTMLQVEPPKI